MSALTMPALQRSYRERRASRLPLLRTRPPAAVARLIERYRFELHNVKAPYHKLNGDQQQELIDLLTKKVEDAVERASRTIAPRAFVSVQLDTRSISVEAKALTVAAKVDASEPSNAELTKAASKLWPLVLAANGTMTA